MLKNWRKKLGYGLAGFTAICAVVIAGGLLWRTSLQNQTRSTRAKIDSVTGVDELVKVEVGGIQQWIHARGVNRSDPVLLYLHGGPGTPMMPFEGIFQNPLENHFIVVHWDQRGVGKTYRENPNLDYPATVTYERMVNDASEMVEILRKRYDKEKIIILGHSWGSEMGLGLLDAASKGIAAYVGTGQVIDAFKDEMIGYAATLAEAKKQNKTEAVLALESIAPYPDKNQVDNSKIEVLREWQMYFGYGMSRRFKGGITNVLLTNALKSPEYSLWDVATFLEEGGSRRWPILSRENGTFKASRFKNTYTVPIFLLLGRHDWVAPSVSAQQWLERIEAPTKQAFWFENSAHSPMVDEPELFARVLIEKVRPFALQNK